ncbi:translation machinery-associated protein 16 [Microbotryomycetes sp. JL201]|nr:translation machinery-associated protein 16 [Microbotryomycetes sp. JL201]
MPGNRVKTLKALQSRKGGAASSKLHPNSRRAKQLQRVELRAHKLQVQGRVHRSGEVKRVDRLLYFVHALDEDRDQISLDELHQIVSDYISRDDAERDELEHERQQRSNWRKTEGKSKRETEIDKQKEQETLEYKTGFVVPDLTNAENVFICRQWVKPIGSEKNPRGSKGGDPLRLISINSEDKSKVAVVQEGVRPDKDEENPPQDEDESEEQEVEMRDA